MTYLGIGRCQNARHCGKICNIDLDVGRIRNTFTLYLYLHNQLRRAWAVQKQWHNLLLSNSFQDLEGGLLHVPHTLDSF